VRFFAAKVDNVFSSHEFRFAIAEDDGRSADATFRPRQVGRVTLASEAVRGSFYIVDGDEAGVFDIDQDAGTITTRKSVDRERGASYRLKVVVQIFGERTFSDCDVVVDVEDVNDNVPTFALEEPAVVSVRSDSAVGQPVHRVSVEDEDFGDNGKIGFRLEDKSGYFAIDPDTGTLFGYYFFQ
jgi:hypothetical protein